MDINKASVQTIYSSASAAIKRYIRALIVFLYRLISIYIPKFLRQNFEVTSNKRWRIAGIITGGILLLAVIIDLSAFTSVDFASKWWLLALVLNIPWIVTTTLAFDIRIKNDLFDKIWHIVLLFLLPIATMTVTECLNGVFIYDMTYLGFFANYVTIIIFYFLVFAFSGDLRLSILIVNPILFGFAIAHSYIMNFRGTPFLPMDFLSVTTAVGVANTYNYTPTYKEMTGILLFCLIIAVGLKVKTPKYNLITRVITRAFTFTFSTVVLILFFGTSILTNLGVKPDFWNQARGYRNYGFVFNFVCNTKYLHMSEPSGYNPEDVDDYVSSTVESSKEQPSKQPLAEVSETSPNIICIMNESLSDLQVLGEFETNKPYMPFINRLKKNTVKGTLYVPVIGAGTSNTEFEFLTGHTTAFLPSGSNAYMLYAKNPIASLVSTLEAQGYSSHAFHPYYASGWNRTTVYQNFGFDRFISLENVFDVSLMQEYKDSGNDGDYLQKLTEMAYPNQKKMLLRQYISDSYDFDWLIEDYKNHDSSVPYFMFNVTMQNHGGYTGTFSNFEQKIHTTSTEKEYVKTNNYLSLMKESDIAFKKLINYFSKVDEPTVICMFGDHQPSIETEFIAEIMGVRNLNGLTLEQEQNRHATPFLIWANYDIEEKKIDKLSSNYLSSLVLDVAGVKLTEYNKYLLELAKVLPVIDTVGYIDNEDNYYSWNDSTPYSDLLDEYERIQYNNIFDQDNKNIDTFYLKDYEYILPEPYSQELLNVPEEFDIEEIVIDEVEQEQETE